MSERSEASDSCRGCNKIALFINAITVSRQLDYARSRCHACLPSSLVVSMSCALKRQHPSPAIQLLTCPAGRLCATRCIKADPKQNIGHSLCSRQSASRRTYSPEQPGCSQQGRQLLIVLRKYQHIFCCALIYLVCALPIFAQKNICDIKLCFLDSVEAQNLGWSLGWRLGSQTSALCLSPRLYCRA